MIKKIFFVFLLLNFAQICFAQQNFSVVPAAVPQSTAAIQSFSNIQQPLGVDYALCIKNYQMPANELFQRTLSAISASGYKIIEMQSKSSRVLFSVWGKEFWAGVTKQNSAASTLRILPADNNYYFKKELIDRVFNEIDMYKQAKILKAK